MTGAESSRGVAFARAALAGNPSDGYGGAVLAVTLPGWQAQAQAVPGEAAVEPANALVQATVDRFSRELAPAPSSSTVRWSTSIPQRVGLGSSSALVIAVTRALCGLHGTEMPPPRLAEFALAVETEEMGIVAGLQDRVVQVYEGLLFMEFSEPPVYEQLDRRRLPPLLIAWHEEAAAHSGDVHGDLRRRHTEGDPAVDKTMAALATTAREAREALLTGNRIRFADHVDATFDLRRQLLTLDPVSVEMVETARATGASANYTGSGGAIVAVCRDEARSHEVSRALASIGCRLARVG